METDKNTGATLMVTDARSFADAHSMNFPSGTQVLGSVEATVATGFGGTAGVALLPTRTAKRHIDPSYVGTRFWSPPV